MNEQVLYLTGDFDSSAFFRIRDLVRNATASAPIVLNFRDVPFCHPFALSELFEILVRTGGAVRALGLSRQHDVLLAYLGHRGADLGEV
jgi:hypothetical protein